MASLLFENGFSPSGPTNLTLSCLLHSRPYITRWGPKSDTMCTVPLGYIPRLRSCYLTQGAVERGVASDWGVTRRLLLHTTHDKVVGDGGSMICGVAVASTGSSEVAIIDFSAEPPSSVMLKPGALLRCPRPAAVSGIRELTDYKFRGYNSLVRIPRLRRGHRLACPTPSETWLAASPMLRGRVGDPVS